MPLGVFVANLELLGMKFLHVHLPSEMQLGFWSRNDRSVYIFHLKTDLRGTNCLGSFALGSEEKKKTNPLGYVINANSYDSLCLKPASGKFAFAKKSSLWHQKPIWSKAD